MNEEEQLLFEQMDQFLLGLRMDDRFDEALFQGIHTYYSNHMSEYKSSGNFPSGHLPTLLFLVDQLAGGSRFWDEETSIKAEDAAIALQELFVGLDELRKD